MPLISDKLIADVQSHLTEAIKTQVTLADAYTAASQAYEDASNRVTSLTSLVKVMTELKELEDAVMARQAKTPVAVV